MTLARWFGPPTKTSRGSESIGGLPRAQFLSRQKDAIVRRADLVMHEERERKQLLERARLWPSSDRR